VYELVSRELEMGSDLYKTLKIEEIISHLEEHGTRKRITWGFEGPEDKITLNRNGATIDALAKFEESHNLVLPSDFRTFLEYADGASIYGVTIYGLGTLKDMNKVLVLEEEHRETEKRLTKTFEFGDYHTGDFLFINFEEVRGAKSENRRDVLDVWHENLETTLIAKSFGEFLHRIIKGARIQNPDGEGNCEIYWLSGSRNPHTDRSFSVVEID